MITTIIFDLSDVYLGGVSDGIYLLDELKNAARKNFKENKGMRKIIEKLRQNGYRLGLLSKTCERMGGIL